jgi:BirA family biotin operon repressor/biotin-[acetyl-CoA-carboxylase] ligase
MFDPLPFALALTTQWLGHPLYYVRETDSTNRLLRDVALAGTPAGTVIVTDYQTAGRGRRGRAWQVPPGSALLFSALLPAFPPERLTLLPIVTAVAVARALERHLALNAFIKWPNDLLLDGRKCGGILVESEWDTTHAPTVVVGIGLNLNQLPADFAELPNATSMYAHTGTPVERAAFLAVLLAELEQGYTALKAGWMPHAEWSRRAGVPGQPLWVHPADGESWAATAVALGASGELIVQDTQGHQIALYAGDVSVRYVQSETYA